MQALQTGVTTHAGLADKRSNDSNSHQIFLPKLDKQSDDPMHYRPQCSLQPMQMVELLQSQKESTCTMLDQLDSSWQGSSNTCRRFKPALRHMGAWLPNAQTTQTPINSSLLSWTSNLMTPFTADLSAVSKKAHAQCWTSWIAQGKAPPNVSCSCKASKALESPASNCRA
jgi:hypothetical protein